MAVNTVLILSLVIVVYDVYVKVWPLLPSTEVVRGGIDVVSADITPFRGIWGGVGLARGVIICVYTSYDAYSVDTVREPW